MGRDSLRQVYAGLIRMTHMHSVLLESMPMAISNGRGLDDREPHQNTVPVSYLFLMGDS